jgi:hypothetical protein
LGYKAVWPNHIVHQQDCNQHATAVPPTFIAKPLKATRIGAEERKTWGIICSSEKKGNECTFAKDEDTQTFWRTDDAKPKPAEGHSIQIDLKKIIHVHGIAMTPVQPPPLTDPEPFPTGSPSHHMVQIKVKATDNWDTVAYGTWYRDTDGKVHSLSINYSYESREC